MSNPITINNEEEQEKIEIPLSEYESIKAVAVGIAEQNAAVQKSQADILGTVKSVLDAIAAQQQAMTDGFNALKDALQGMNIVVNVPEQPAPVVNFTAPEQPAPVVNVSTPAEKGKRVVKVKRGKNGYASEYEIE